MENLCALFFELSSEDRLRILRQIEKSPTNVSNLSRKLDLTTQESSRHTSRLSDVGLINKDSEGLYHLTFYGALVLKQTEGLAFASQHRHYFASHSLMQLPPQFVGRIGDLAESKYVDDISDAFHRVDRVIKQAEDYIWTITDQYLVSTLPLLREAVERGVKVRNIEAKGWIVSSGMIQAWYTEEATPFGEVWAKARTSGLLDERIAERLDVYLYMSDKEVAGVAFPLRNGRFDYLGFATTDERAHKWCQDLFQYYWERARSRESIVEELHSWIKNRPRAIHALREIAEGKKTAYREDLVSELESVGLVKQGRLTMLGEFVYVKLRQ